MISYISKEYLSVIVTTSPIQSHPTTDIIDQSLSSLNRFQCMKYIPIYIICDGAKISKDEDKYKSGIVTAQTWENYTQYILRLKEKYNDQEKYKIIERDSRYGFAQNIKFAMETLVDTEHVLIYQHDHVIDGEIDFVKVLETIRKHKQSINYITFMNKSYFNLVPKLLANKEMRKLLVKIANKPQNFNTIENVSELTSGICDHFQQKYGLDLVPLNFWYDKVHIASRKYYLETIFNPKGNYDPHVGKNQKTVSFVEDTFGHCMKWCIDQKPQQILNYGAYVLWNEKSVVYHSKGRSYVTEKIRQDKYLIHKNYEKEEQDNSSEQDHPLFIELQQERD